jgi:hypothetical protein
VDGRHAVLRAVGGHAEDLERAEVGGDEGQPRDPCRQRAAGEKEVEVGLDREPGYRPDPENDEEIDREDRVIQRARVEPEHANLPSACGPSRKPAALRADQSLGERRP